jgi:hypothetical protein
MTEENTNDVRNKRLKGLIIRTVIGEIIIIILCYTNFRRPKKNKLFLLLRLFFLFIFLQTTVLGLLHPYYFAYKNNISDDKIFRFKADQYNDVVSILTYYTIIICGFLSYGFSLMDEMPLPPKIIMYAVGYICLYFYIIRNNKRYIDYYSK